MQAGAKLSTLLTLLLAPLLCGAQDREASRQVEERDEPFLLTYPNLKDLDGDVLLTNDHVVVQRFVVLPGEWEGIHSHPGNQLYVHVKGGEWSGRLGGKSEYAGSVSADGEVGWMNAIPLGAGHESGNTGDAPIDLVWVTLKDDAPVAPESEHASQIYPRIPSELLLENERIIVQRMQMEPGQWTGIHGHPGNQLYIHIKGGAWSERRGGVESTPAWVSKPGAVNWVDVIDRSEAHEVGNTGDTTMDLILISLK